jgi:hypothetical protein
MNFFVILVMILFYLKKKVIVDLWEPLSDNQLFSKIYEK